MSTKIKYVGEDSYHSSDIADNDQPINLNAGESIKVSDAKAAQLAADMPHLFEIDGKPAADAPKPPKQEAVEDVDPLAGLEPIELLERLKLAQLVEVSELAGVDADVVAKLKKPGTSKAAAIAAIGEAKPLVEVVETEQVAELIKATATK